MDRKITESNTGSADSPGFNTRYTLDRLSNDVLLSIWNNLDDPLPFSLVNKRFQALSKDTLWRAKWLMQRYERYLVIFEAIARPKLFTPSLLDRLIRLGAPLSVNLIQLIQLMWNATVRSLMYETDRSIRWGRITLAAYAALMQHASEQIDGTFSFETSEFESSLFEGWMDEQEDLVEYNRTASPNGRVRQLFEKSFLPLPLTIAQGEDFPLGVFRSRADVVTLAIGYDAELLCPAKKTGYELTPARTDAILRAWRMIFGRTKAKTLAEAHLSG